MAKNVLSKFIYGCSKTLAAILLSNIIFRHVFIVRPNNLYANHDQSRPTICVDYHSVHQVMVAKIVASYLQYFNKAMRNICNFDHYQ